jgi:hypothetical protein
VVAPPSHDFTTYIEGELVRVSIPSNWRELPGSNAVTFAPEGANGNVGVKSVFTHGVAMGLARNDKHNLRVTSDDFIVSYVLLNPRPGRAFRYRNVRIGEDRPGLQVEQLNEGRKAANRKRLIRTVRGETPCRLDTAQS